MAQALGTQAEEYVIDASAAFEYLLNTTKGQRIAERINDVPPVVPELRSPPVLDLDFDAAAAIREDQQRREQQADVSRDDA